MEAHLTALMAFSPWPRDREILIHCWGAAPKRGHDEPGFPPPPYST